MRIALLSSYHDWHGGEVVLSALTEGLAARGHEVALLCRPATPLSERFAGRADVRVLTAPLRGEGNPRTHVEVGRALRSARSEVLLTNLSRDLKFGALAARLLGVPHVHRYAQVARAHILRGDPVESGPAVASEAATSVPGDAAGGAGFPAPAARPRSARAPGAKRVTGRLLRGWVAGCVTPSRFVRRSLLALYPGMRPVRVVHNGVDASRFRPDPEAGRRWRAARGLGPGELVVGCVGELDLRRKAQQVVVEAVAAARSRPRLVLLGAGAGEGVLRSLAGRLGVEPLFAGFEPDTPAAYSAFDVVAFASRAESFGLAVAEAMACGRPVVAVSAASIPELIRTGREGWLVARDDAGGMAAAIDMLASDPPLRAAVGARARERVEREFSLTRMLEGYEEALAAAREGRFGVLPADGAEQPATAGATAGAAALT